MVAIVVILICPLREDSLLGACSSSAFTESSSIEPVMMFNRLHYSRHEYSEYQYQFRHTSGLYMSLSS
jgi:hypothetical protein